MNTNHKLESAMRYIYGHFLEDGEPLADFMKSRFEPRPNVRHITRRKLYHHLGVTYKAIATAEARFNGGNVTNLSTIAHSVHKPREGFRDYERADRTIGNLIGEFEDYWLGLQEPEIEKRLKHYYEMPHHVLAVITCFAEQFGWVERAKLEGLEREFRTVSKEFVEKQF